jgi:hypothetical protein
MDECSKALSNRVPGEPFFFFSDKLVSSYKNDVGAMK